MGAPTLADLPLDIWEPISAFLLGLDIGGLWLTGCKRLIKKLHQSVTVFKHHYGPRTTKKWPRLIGQLPKLKELSLSPHLETILYDIDLSIVPSGVQRMNIQLSNGFLGFFDIPPTSSSSSSSEVQFAPKAIGKMFPSLESLEIADIYQVIKSNGLQKSFGLLMPPNLTHLALQGVIDASCMNQLPKTVTSLYIVLSYGKTEPVYPPHLKTLHLWPMRAIAAPFIPDSVTDLLVEPDIATSLPLDFQWPSKLIKFEYIAGTPLSDESVQKFPSSLQHLRIKNCFSTQDFAFLPRNLQSFSSSCRSYSFAPPTNQQILNLPSNLTAMTLPRELLVESNWKHLPRSLKNLRSDDNDDEEQEKPFHIDATKEMAPYFADLPEMVEITVSISIREYFDPVKDETHQPLLASISLPKGTKGLHITVPRSSDLFHLALLLERLPGLDALHISLGHAISAHNQNSSFPSAVVAGVSDWTMDFLDRCASPLRRLMMVVGDRSHFLNLTTLKFSGYWATRLESLSLYLSEHWFEYSGLSGPQWVSSLPRTLVELDLQTYQCPFPTPSPQELFKALPPHLKIFTAFVASLHPNDLSYLPNSLQRINIGDSTKKEQKTQINSANSLLEGMSPSLRFTVTHLNLPVSFSQISDRDTSLILKMLPSIQHYALGKNIKPTHSKSTQPYPALAKLVESMRACHHDHDDET